MENLLYRGVSESIHRLAGAALRPKETAAFARRASWDKAAWDESDWGESIQNGVVEHQLEQAGFPTSGISTTPHLQRAIYYATHGDRAEVGYVYVIDRATLDAHHIRVHVVSDHVTHPSAPNDDEVILVANDCGPLPSAIVLEVRRVSVQLLVQADAVHGPV
ncbi:MAG: hypothetical protein ABI843_15105 [Dokdonella sp.]